MQRNFINSKFKGNVSRLSFHQFFTSANKIDRILIYSPYDFLRNVIYTSIDSMFSW